MINARKIDPRPIPQKITEVRSYPTTSTTQAYARNGAENMEASSGGISMKIANALVQQIKTV